MAIIEDGLGSGKKAGVNDENRFMVHAITESLEYHTNSIEEKAYHLLFQVTPVAEACFVYVKNDNHADIIIKGIQLRTGGDEIIEVHMHAIGTPLGGTETTPVNCNAGTGNDAQGVFLTGSDITGLTINNPIERFYIKGDAGSKYFNFNQDLIIPPNQSITIHAVTGGIEVDGTLVFFFHSKNI